MGEQLVSRNLLDALILAVPPRCDADATTRSRECGYDPAGPHAFYPIAVAVCVAVALGETLDPNYSVAEQQYELGKAAVHGYARTVPGRMAVGGRRPMPVGGVLRYYLRFISHDQPALRWRIEDVEAQSCVIHVSGLVLHPAFLRGLVERIVEVVGCSEPHCEYEAVDELEYRYTVRWVGTSDLRKHVST
jgi:uncharacterized protein (TIGR02265 family)